MLNQNFKKLTKNVIVPNENDDIEPKMLTLN